MKIRRKIAKKLNKELKDLVGLRTPIVKNECTHSYYAYPMVIDTKMLGVSKQKIPKENISEVENCSFHLLELFFQTLS